MARLERSTGFTLTEVLVAFTVLALSLGALYESFGWTLRRSRAVEHRDAAIVLAQSILTLTQLQIRTHGVVTPEGHDGGMRWRAKLSERALEESSAEGWRAFDVEVAVAFGAGSKHQVVLRGVELQGPSS